MFTSHRAVTARHALVPFLVLFGLAACGGGGGEPAKAPTQGAGSEGAPSAAPASDRDEASSDAPESAGGPAGGESGDDFKTQDTHTAKDTHGVKKSNIKPTATEAALKFIVVDKENGPVEGIVVSLTDKEGKKYYTEETDAVGYADVLVPIGKKYDVVYLSLGQEDITASVLVEDKPRLSMKLTLRFKGWSPKKGAKSEPPRFELNGVTFDTGKSSIRGESFPRLDTVVEYMTHKKRARIEISGHTDNVGNKKTNKALSDKRAHACRDYLISKGIDGSRIEAVGFGDERPVAPNDTAEGREQNRRIEAREL